MLDKTRIYLRQLERRIIMNWKKESENELRDYGRKQVALINIPKFLDHIKYELSLIEKNKTDFEYNRNAKNKWDDLFIENIVKKNELERNLFLTKSRIELVERGLCGVTNDERRLLKLFYIDRPDDCVQKLCDEFDYEKSSIYNCKDVALRKFTMAMYGVNHI